MAQRISDRIDPGSWILEQLTLLLPDVEMAAGRRAWYEAKAAWPGQENRLWWKWTAEAADSIGLSTKTVDCTIAEAIQLLNSGVKLVTWDVSETDGEIDHHGQWMLMQKVGSHKCDVSSAGGLTENKSMSMRKAKKLLSQLQVDGRIRCVVVRTDFSTGSHDTRGLNPFARLVALLKPE